MIEVAYTLNDGKERLGTMIRENAKTILIYPLRWVKCDPVLVHKIKNRARVLTGRKAA